MPAPKLGRKALIAALFLAALVVQAGVSFVLEPEPYPAVKMPSFGDAPNASGIFPTTVASLIVSYKDGTSLTPHVTELFSDFRFSSARYSLDYLFKPGSGRPVDAEVLQWLDASARKLAPGKLPERIDMCWQKTDLDVRDGTYKSMSPCESVRITL